MRKEPMKARQKAGQAGASLCRLVHSGARATFSLEQLFAAMVAQTVPSRVRRDILNEETWGWVGVTQNILRGGEGPYLLVRQGREGGIKISRRGAGASSGRERYR